MTNSEPKFVIISHPIYGYLKLLSKHKKSENRIKRSNNEDLTEFTFEDIIRNRISYVAYNNLDLTYPNEILVDAVHYEVSAHNVAPALGKLVINIVSHKLF